MNDIFVKRTGRLCEIGGHITDATKFAPHRQEFVLSRDFNLSKLYSISWLGIRHLLQELSALEVKGAFCEIPAHIYKIMLMVPHQGGFMRIKSFEAKVIDKNRSHELKLIDMDSLVNTGVLFGSFATLDDGTQLIGSLRHLCRSVVIHSDLPRTYFTNLFSHKNHDQVLFWYDYMIFVGSIFDLGILAQQANTRNIEDTLQEILNITNTLESSAKLLDETFHPTIADELKLFLNQEHEASKETVLSFTEFRDLFQNIGENMQDFFLTRLTPPDVLYDFIQSAGDASSNIQMLASTLDKVGGEFVAKIEHICNFSTLAYQFKKNGEIQPEIAGYFSQIDVLISKVILHLQNYEILKQVLDHRAYEAEIITQLITDIREERLHWEQASSEILIAAAQKFVLDQERDAFAFYFPKVQIYTCPLVPSGEVSFLQ